MIRGMRRSFGLSIQEGTEQVVYDYTGVSGVSDVLFNPQGGGRGRS